MTFSGGGITITTWGADAAGNQVWRARTENHVAEFVMDRCAPVDDLFAKARLAVAAQALSDALG